MSLFCRTMHIINVFDELLLKVHQQQVYKSSIVVYLFTVKLLRICRTG